MVVPAMRRRELGRVRSRREVQHENVVAERVVRVVGAAWLDD
jgi:hypothetical protein